MNTAIKYSMLFLIAMLFAYLMSFLFWSEPFILSFSEYPGSCEHLSPRIQASRAFAHTLARLSPREKTLFDSFYEYSEERKQYRLKPADTAESYELFSALQNSGYQDSTPSVFYLSVNERGRFEATIYSPLIEVECALRGLTLVSE
jgi:hypothetical protein